MALLTMSLTASVLILSIAILRACALGRLPKITFVMLWILVLVLLLIPFPMLFNHTGIVEHVPPVPADDRVIATTMAGAIGPQAVSDGRAAPVRAERGRASSDDSPFAQPRNGPILGAIWLAGGMLTALRLVVPHVRNRRIFNMSIPVHHPFVNRWLAEHRTLRRIQVRSSDRIASPLTYGVMRPVILLPKNLDFHDTEALRFVLTHEWIHIKRNDVLLKGLLAFGLCIHWFNPIVWLMAILAARDIELACDEAVLRHLPDNRSYAKLLIGLAETGCGLNRSFAHFSKKPLEERIEMLMNMRKASTIGAFLILAAAFGASIALASSGNDAANVFRQVFSDDYDRYRAYINEVHHPRIVAEAYSLELKSTLFTDHQVYAIVGLEGAVPETLAINGRIVHDNGFQTHYELDGGTARLDSDHETHYFLYQANIIDSLDGRQANPDVVLAAGNFPDRHTLLDAEEEGSLLELAVQAGDTVHLLVSPVASVVADAIVLRPESRGKGLFFDKIIVTSREVKMTGSGTDAEIGLGEIPHVEMTIVLNHGKKLHFRYDSKGTTGEDGRPLGLSRGTTGDGRFYHYWDFRNWTLDLKEVKKIVVNGETFRIGSN
jgi:beta-lactamase regulating signal transducer with metallopeptidase domain